MTNMKTVLFTNESRASPDDADDLTKGWVFNGDNYAIGIRRQQSGSVVMIWDRVPEELNCPLTCIARS